MPRLQSIAMWMARVGEWYLRQVDPEFAWRYAKVKRLKREGVSAHVIQHELDKLGEYVRTRYPKE
jgi:hypothetical protein